MALQAHWADTEEYRDAHMTVMVEGAGGELPVGLELTDAKGRRLGGGSGGEGGRRELPGADVLTFVQGALKTGDFAIIRAADAVPYAGQLHVLRNGTFHLGIVAEGSAGELVQVVFSDVAVALGDELSLVIEPAGATPVRLLRNGTDVASGA